jgi:hypothetical protein
MTPAALQLARRIHHEVGHLPDPTLVPLAAGDVIHLLNALWGEEKRADVAEARLAELLQQAALKRWDELFKVAET